MKVPRKRRATPPHSAKKPPAAGRHSAKKPPATGHRTPRLAADGSKPTGEVHGKVIGFDPNEGASASSQEGPSGSNASVSRSAGKPQRRPFKSSSTSGRKVARPGSRPSRSSGSRSTYSARLTRKSPAGYKGRRKAHSTQLAAANRLPGQRLQKVLAAAGFGSRRKCEELITTGRVEIDRQVVTQLGTRVETDKQQIRVDGETVNLGRRVYFAVNKPRGVVSTNSDPAGRPRVIDLMPPQAQRCFTIGRLDLSSEGLIIVTNDGDLANRLAHPRYGVPKTYLVQVAGKPEQEVIDKLKHGVHLAEGFVKAEDIRVKSQHKESTWLEIVLKEGMNREIRRVMARVGHKVMRLVRVSVGPIKLGKLLPGAVRPLVPHEIEELRALVGGREDHG